MNSKKITLIVTAAAVVVGASVWFFLTRNSNLPKYIPNSVLTVLKLNPLSIGRKIDFDEVKKLKSYQPMINEFKKDDKGISKMLENPKEAGIGFTDNYYMFVENGENYNYTTGFVLPVSDADALKKFIEKMTKNSNYQYEKSGDLHIMAEKEPEMAKYEGEEESMYHYKPDITSIVWNDEACLIYTSKNNCLKTAKKIMSQPKEQSILANDNFNCSESEGGDFSAFINMKSYMDAVFSEKKGMQLSAFPKELKAWIDNINAFSYVLNFNDNDISAEGFNYYKDKNKAEEFAFLQNTGLSNENMEVLSPDGKLLIGAGSMLNMEGVFKFLKTMPQYKTAIKEISTATTLSETELENLLDGSFAIAMTKIGSKQVEELVYDYEHFDMETGEFPSSIQTVSKIVPNITAQFGVKEEKSFKKLMAQIAKMTNGMIKETDGIYTIPTQVPYLGNLSMVFAKNKIVFTNDLESAKILAKNKTWNNQLEKSVSNLFTDNASALYLDLNMKNYGESNIRQMIGATDDSEGFKIFKDNMANFTNVTSYGNMKSTILKLNFSEGKGNSIMRLIGIADNVATYQRRKTAERQARMRELESQLNMEAMDTVAADVVVEDAIAPDNAK